MMTITALSWIQSSDLTHCSQVHYLQDTASVSQCKHLPTRPL